MSMLNRIDPIDCGCNDCYSGRSKPFSAYGDPLQWNMLLHQGARDSTGDGDGYGWMEVAAEHCPKRFAEWIAQQYRAGHLISRHVLNAEVAATVIGDALDRMKNRD